MYRILPKSRNVLLMASSHWQNIPLFCRIHNLIYTHCMTRNSLDQGQLIPCKVYAHQEGRMWTWGEFQFRGDIILKLPRCGLCALKQLIRSPEIVDLWLDVISHCSDIFLLLAILYSRSPGFIQVHLIVRLGRQHPMCSNGLHPFCSKPYNSICGVEETIAFSLTMTENGLEMTWSYRTFNNLHQQRRAHKWSFSLQILLPTSGLFNY